MKLQLVAKFEKIEGDTWEIFKYFRKKYLNEIFEQYHSAENVTGGTLWDFLRSIVLQNIETNEEETIWWNPKNFKKSRIVSKKSE